MKLKRPLSPHLSIYKLQISSGLSILHRITGVALLFGFLVLGWLLIALLMQKTQIAFVGYDLGIISNNIVFKVCVFGMVASFYYHFFSGIRHLFWDAGFGFSLTAMRWSGYSVLILSLAMTLITFCCAVGLV